MSSSADRSVVRRAAFLFVAGVAASAASFAAVTAASAATTATDPNYAVSINQGNVPTTAPAYKNHSCDEFGSKAATQDGWLFVASPDDFTKFKAIFKDNNNVERDVFWDNVNNTAGSAGGTSVAFPKQFDHLAVTAPGGWTLQNAFANLSGDQAFFTLSHTCAATQQPSSQPTVSFTDNCTAKAIGVSLGNAAGTDDALFTLSGGLSKQDTLAPGDTASEQVPVGNDGKATITVAAAGLAGTPVTHTFDSAACGTTQSGGSPTPSVTFKDGCDIGGTVVTLANTGTSAADFVVHYDGADHAFTVSPGATTSVTVPVANGASKTVTVSSGGQQIGSHTFDASGCSTPTTAPTSGTTGGTTGGVTAQHAINPAASFGTACKTGITVTLSNKKLDNATTEPVTFTITTPAGSTETVTVGADQVSKRSYPVKEDSTGTVTVTAPGMSKQSKSYAKNCATVLGEKISKPVTKPVTKPVVQGEKVAKLPFTGAPASQLLADAVALLGGGLVLTLAGRRPRRRGAHAKR